MNAFDFECRTRVIFGAGMIERLGDVAAELGFRQSLFVADPGLVASGHVDEALRPLRQKGIETVRFHDFLVNPDSAMVEAGRILAESLHIDSIIALGGGSSLDCAKGINLVLTNGGEIQNYAGYRKATRPLLPMIGIPTTAGTGSEAQTYALISDARTHQKMACGDPGLAFRVAILDPALTVSQPANITATSGFDALAHAVETYVTIKRNSLSELFSRESWRMLEGNYERVISNPDDLRARGAMQLGAYFAGMAIEHSMLGATHACANPLTAHYGTIHGAAIALLLASVVRWNGSVVRERYGELLSLSSAKSLLTNQDPAEVLARRLEELAKAGRLATTLQRTGVPKSSLPMLAEEAATQWTGGFNPRHFDAAGALEIYEQSYC